VAKEPDGFRPGPIGIHNDELISGPEAQKKERRDVTENQDVASSKR
jgi:hypothetical protein